MLFYVDVVSQEDYDAYIQSLIDKGQTGVLGADYDANTNQPGTDAPTGKQSGQKARHSYNSHHKSGDNIAAESEAGRISGFRSTKAV
ncbi:MAG: hypothetical protein KIT06_00165 [Cryobacterium sp.]|nr:hypothetical protein [Cryobacterium sp.]